MARIGGSAACESQCARHFSGGRRNCSANGGNYGNGYIGPNGGTYGIDSIGTDGDGDRRGACS